MSKLISLPEIQVLDSQYKWLENRMMLIGARDVESVIIMLIYEAMEREAGRMK